MVRNIRHSIGLYRLASFNYMEMSEKKDLFPIRESVRQQKRKKKAKEGLSLRKENQYVGWAHGSRCLKCLWLSLDCQLLSKKLKRKTKAEAGCDGMNLYSHAER